MFIIFLLLWPMWIQKAELSLIMNVSISSGFVLEHLSKMVQKNGDFIGGLEIRTFWYQLSTFDEMFL